MDTDLEEILATIGIFITVVIMGSLFFICYKEEKQDNRIHPSDSIASCGV
jgi:hypothetical protein